jgi:hypothetical protein
VLTPQKNGGKRFKQDARGLGRKRALSTAAYIVWNLWNESNRRIFQDKTLSPKEVPGRIRDDIAQLRLAFRR